MKATYELDDTDRELLALLQTNARESTANIARELGLARTTVLARLTRLERSGIIQGYGVRISRALSSQGVAAYVGISILPKSGAAVLKALARFPELEHLTAVSGQFDYVAVVRCRSTEHLDTMLDAIGALEGVKQTLSAVILATRIDRSRLSDS
ncbi:MAG: Lrp/AsnC family transcriptional regulator [Burkholderiaceae bacterium]|jgi:DNA-binding Lrp family transcriptional regulator